MVEVIVEEIEVEEELEVEEEVVVYLVNYEPFGQCGVD